MRSKKRLSTCVSFDLKQRMIHFLMFRSGFVYDPGLFSGKMGLVLFFAHYYRTTSEDIYDTIADELMEQVLENVHKELPIGLGTGLCGIGWSIEYLIQNGFMEGNSSEICEEIDRKIMEKDPRRMEDLSLEEGMEGLFHYVLAHISGALKNQTALPFDTTYLNDLYCAAEVLQDKEDLCDELKNLIGCYVKFHQGKEAICYKPDLASFIGKIEVNEKQLTTYPPGLKDGIAGVLLRPIIN